MIFINSTTPPGPSVIARFFIPSFKNHPSPVPDTAVSPMDFMDFPIPNHL
jgi:hypothetical protein